MERPDRSLIDESQKAKLIFGAIAAVVFILLIFSFVRGNRIRGELDAARNEVQSLKADNTRLSQYLETRTQEMERYKRSFEDCRTKLRYSAPAKKTSRKRSTSTKTKTRR